MGLTPVLSRREKNTFRLQSVATLKRGDGIAAEKCFWANVDCMTELHCFGILSGMHKQPSFTPKAGLALPPKQISVQVLL